MARDCTEGIFKCLIDGTKCNLTRDGTNVSTGDGTMLPQLQLNFKKTLKNQWFIRPKFHLLVAKDCYYKDILRQKLYIQDYVRKG